MFKTISPFILIVLLFLIIPTQHAFAQTQTCETRSVWLNPYAFNSNARRQATLEKIEAANLNTVFLGGTSNSQESFQPMYQSLVNRGIDVQVWLAVNSGGTVDFTDPTQRQTQVNRALTWLNNYPNLKGVHFDYIRYPYDENWPHQTQAKLDGVTETVRATHQAIKNRYPDKVLTAAVIGIDPQWINLNHYYIPSWFLDWMNAHPGNIYESANPANAYEPSGFRYAQDPVFWLRNQIIDGVFVMGYTTSLKLWQRRLPLWQSFLNNDTSKVAFGLAWFPYDRTETWPDGESYPIGGYNPQAVVQQIKYARQQGLKGFAIFEFGRPEDWAATEDDYLLINALTQPSQINENDPPFKNPIRSCLSDNLTSPTPTPSPSQSPSPSLPICFSSVDSIINGNDAQIWASNYLLNNINLDTNNNNKINSFEFGYLLNHWGESCQN